MKVTDSNEDVGIALDTAFVDGPPAAFGATHTGLPQSTPGKPDVGQLVQFDALGFSTTLTPVA